jgi:hypothetical protein
MNIKSFPFKLCLSILIAIFAFYINYYYANKGLNPIDTFSFFDTGYYTAKGYHPVKDFWVISGILIDYIQGLFFYIFGFNWNAYVFHASFFNIIISLFFFYFLNQFSEKIIYNFFLSICVAILCYPVVGTPFPYQHSFILSLISLLIFYLAINKENKIYWFILPFLMLLSFLSMQLPSGIINLLIIIFLLFYFINFDKFFLKYFFLGSFLSLIIFFSYFLITKVSIDDFFTQIILFPLTVGQGRIISEENAFESAKLINKLTIRGILGHFKFINIFLFANIALMIFHVKKNLKKFKLDRIIFVNIFVLFCGIGFIFHQLITANQTFIFSLAPILCGLLMIQIDRFESLKNRNLIQLFLFILILFVTAKYHLVYNEKRKFMDLQNVDLSTALSAKMLNGKFNNLLWITPHYYSRSPKNELDLLNQSIKIIKKDPNEKMLITHYQFFSLLIDDDLHIPNRWYFPNNTFPSSKENKYYDNYIEKFNEKLNEKKINIIYIVETFPGEFEFLNFKDLLKKRCFEKKEYNEILYSIKIKNCI